jgi:tellurite resistance protein TehA-like permease
VRVRLADLEPSPDVFAAVMATGILSVAAAQHEYRQISEMLGILATLGLAVLVVLVIVTRRFAAWDLKDPDVTLRLFTFVAACAVLDSRLADEPSLACALGVAALVSWLVLIALSARNMSSHPFAGLRDDAHGAWELASVGTSGLAIVATKVALNTSAHWVLQAALPIWVTALCIYGLMTWLVLWRTVAERQDRDGFEPDTWILMGGLTIATLAVTVVTWVVATLWIPPLIYFGLHRISNRPEMLHFGGVWWAFVFPLGMYSAATYTMVTEIGQRSLLTVSLVFFWDALAAWLIVTLAGLLLACRALVSARGS